MTKKNVLQTAIINAVITVVVAAGLTYTDPSRWFQFFFAALVFTNCIGFSIRSLVQYVAPLCGRRSLPVRMAVLLGLFLAGGIAGTELGILVLTVTLGLRFGVVDQIHVLLFNLILSAVFGSAATMYFTLRERAERLAISLKEKELAEERLTRLKTKAELEALQSKINPHFLFNTLNSIASLISENPKAAEATVERLSELFRYTLQHAEKSVVTVAEELDLVRTYLEIEKVRLGERLRYDVTCDSGAGAMEIPAMLIQPLVENSIKHGISPSVEGGTILVEAKDLDGTCVIAVQDSGTGFRTAGDESGFGLRSIRERLRLLYGERASLEVRQNDHTRVVITIPYR
jgi:two-component system LytT family sensor kinase